MAKKNKKKFPKKQLLSLFESGNYQKVISKAKQFEIEGMGEDELNTLLVLSYQELAHSNFTKGDIVRALRDIDSLLQCDSSEMYQLTKLKYLCYVEYFEEAIKLGEMLVYSKDTKIKKEAIFFYLLATLYNGNSTLDNTLLKMLPKAKQNYLLGFAALMAGNSAKALEYFEASTPHAKVEKENLNALKAIIQGEELEYDCALIKPLYCFLLSGDDEGLANTKNSRMIKPEVQKQFATKNKNSAMRDLLALKSAIPIEAIVQNAKDKEQEIRLIYNNIALLVDKQKYDKALHLFVQYRNRLINLIESATLFIILKHHTEDEKSDRILVNFFSNYLKLHHSQIAPFQIDYILLFLLRYEGVHPINLAQIYGRESFVFLLKELPTLIAFQPSYQESFNNVVKRYSVANSTLLKAMANTIESIEEEIEELNKKENEVFLGRLSVLLILLQNADKPHRKYQESLFHLLKILAFITQSFSYTEHKKFYRLLANVIERYIDYFGVNRIDLAIDIKALFVSISREASVKQTRRYTNEGFWEIGRRILMGEEYIEKEKYDFKEEEYDIALIKNQCLKNLETKSDKPFAPLLALKKYRYFEPYVSPLMLDLMAKSMDVGIKDTSVLISDILSTLNLSLSDSAMREDLVSAVKTYASKDLKVALLLLEYAINSVESSRREYVWYLKWLEGYITIFTDYKLEPNSTLQNVLKEFLRIQKKKKFKSMNAKYNKILKLFTAQ